MLSQYETAIQRQIEQPSNRFACSLATLPLVQNPMTSRNRAHLYAVSFWGAKQDFSVSVG